MENTLAAKIARQVWSSDPEEINAEAAMGTPYSVGTDDLLEIVEICDKHYGEQIQALKKSAAYNAYLSARFMGALVVIFQQREINGVDASVAIASEALTVQSFESFEG